jgi:predicted O-methyltransferase YrrM
VETVEELSNIAFGFMASKALFGALHIDLFTKVAEGAQTIPELSKVTGVPESRIRVLATALAGIGLLVFDKTTIENAPAAESFLVRGAPYDFGDYMRFQIDRQMYPFLGQLNEVIDGSLPDDAVASYAQWMDDPDEALTYSKAQHSGSLGPGKTLARLVDLSEARMVLDVGGGTGAMSISLCKAYPELQSTIVDFPNVSAIGERFIADAGMSDRIRYQPGNALETAWADGQDAVLMSYLFSGIPGETVPQMMSRAFDALDPGGTYMIHDFIVESDRTGPQLAALWQLQHMSFTPDADSLLVGEMRDMLSDIGFVDVQDAQMIPGMTKLVWARKAA